MAAASRATPRLASIDPRRWGHGGLAAGVGGELVGPLQQGRGPVGLPGQPGRVGGVPEAAAAQLLGGGELGRPLQRPGGGRVPAAAPGPSGRAFQLVGHLEVGLDGRGRQMPGPAVGMLLATERGCERPMDCLPPVERRPPVDRRAHQRMVEPHAPLGDAQQPGRLRHPERLGVHPERPSRPQDDLRVAGLLSRRRRQQRLGRLGQAADPFEEHLLDADAGRQGVGKRRPTGELAGVQ
jgi:hypothetical protein